MNIIASAVSVAVYANIVLGLLYLLPTKDQMPLPPQIHDAILSLVGYITPWGYLIDFNTLFLVVSIAVGFEFVVWSFEGIMWLYRHIFKSVL